MLLNSDSCFFFHECTVSQHSKSNKCLQAQAISQQSMDHESVQDNSENMHRAILPRYHIHRGRGCPKILGWSAQKGSWVRTTSSFKNPAEHKDHHPAALKILKKQITPEPLARDLGSLIWIEALPLWNSHFQTVGINLPTSSRGNSLQCLWISHSSCKYHCHPK